MLRFQKLYNRLELFVYLMIITKINVNVMCTELLDVSGGVGFCVLCLGVVAQKSMGFVTPIHMYIYE